MQLGFAVFVCGQLVVWGFSVLLARIFQRRQERSDRRSALAEPVSVIVLVPGLSREEGQAATSALTIEDDNCEIIVVADHEQEAVVDLIRQAARQDHSPRSVRFVFGRDGESANPKLDSLKVGIRAAQHDVLAVIDGNVSVPVDFLARVRAGWTGRDSVVTALPVARSQGGFWGGVEAAWINNVYWRWVSTGWVLGIPAVIGKLLVFRKSWLNAQGGPARLSDCAAEDGALAELALATDTPIRPIDAGFTLELYQRSFTDMMARALRWAVIRRKDRPGVFAAELLNTLASILFLSAIWMYLAGQSLWPVWGLILLYWHGLEAWLSLAQKRLTPWLHVEVFVRDFLTVPVWVAGWLIGRYVWRGHLVELD